MAKESKKTTGGASKAKKGVSTKKISLDKSGRFQLDDSQLDRVSGGRSGIEIIRGSSCTNEPTVGATRCKVIRGSTCGPA